MSVPAPRRVAPRAVRAALVGASALGAVTVAVMAFAMSFDALTQLARGAGIRQTIAWMWPVVVDGSMIVATAAALVLRNSPERAVRLYPWAQLGLFALVSVVGNGLHALGTRGAVTLPGPVAVAVSGVPPVALLLSTHLLVMMLPRWRWSLDHAEAARAEPVHESVTREPDERPAEVTSGPDVDRELTRGSRSEPIQVSHEPEREPVQGPTDEPGHERVSEPELVSEPGQVDRELSGVTEPEPEYEDEPARGHNDPAALAKWVSAMEADGELVSGQVVADYLAVSLSTGKRRLRAAREILEDAA